MKMKDMCEFERPREKMLSVGARALSSSELLAVLIRNGSREESALDLANRLLRLADGNLVKMFSMPFATMKTLKGIGPLKACSIMAAFELGRRFLEEKASEEIKTICTARGVYELMSPTMKGLGHEEFRVIFLNRAGRLIGKETLSSGGTDRTIIDNKMVMEAALRYGAHSMILVHNHPSGDPRPSRGDIASTESLKKACSSFGISLLDHVIVCNDCFWSFADDRLYGA